MNDELIVLRKALEQIASGEVPCVTCNRVHIGQRVDHTVSYFDWSDPEDGHPYKRMTAEAVAKRALG